MNKEQRNLIDYLDGIINGDMEINSKSQFRRITAQLVAKLDKAEALAASRLELLRRGIKPLNSVEYKIWLEDVAKELGDVQ